MDKLLPCPFCGEVEDLHAGEHHVTCGNCGASAGSMCKTKEINISIWNTRSLDAAMEIKIDQYEPKSAGKMLKDLANNQE